MDLTLADWRQRTAALYLSDLDLAGFRAGRDAMFATHPQSPVDPSSFEGLPYYPASDHRCEATLHPVDGPEATATVEVDTGGEDGVVTYRRLGRVDTPWGALTLFWIAAYGGGLFLPFRDATSGQTTYGGGRYLTDTVKGTFGRGVTLTGGTTVRLDFDYAYNPSCAYDSRWACPLPPVENWLEQPVEAGERTLEGP
ncbi:DUF1684 domain-containing protein [Jatrophihabitans sp. YIM 134969]